MPDPDEPLAPRDLDTRSAQLTSLIKDKGIDTTSGAYRRDRRESGRWLAALALPILAPLAWLLTDEGRWLALTLVAAVAINLLVFAITRATDRFGWYALAVFLSVPLLGGVAGVVRTHRTPKVHAVAVVRKGDDVAVCGILITENDKRLYIGRRGAAGTIGTIFWIPESDIDMVRIGAYVGVDAVRSEVDNLASQLYTDRAEQHPDALKATTTVTTTPGRGSTASTVKTKESPAAGQHPTLKARPSQNCTGPGGPNRNVKYDP